jgi:peptidoglycan-associated lipoprotein
MNGRSLRILYLLAIMMIIAALGCQKRISTQPDATRQGQQPAVTEPQKEKVSEQKIDSKVESVGSKDLDAQYTESKAGMFDDVLFEYDRYDVKETYKSVLQSLSAWMIKNDGARLSIEGHCDDRGTGEYNLALGDRRAKAVKDYLITLGVPSSRIDIISYGEEKPACREQTEACWAKNRRAHFVILTKAGK